MRRFVRWDYDSTEGKGLQTLARHTNRIVLLLFTNRNGIIPTKEANVLEQTFLTKLIIEKVRHLHDISILLSETERKNLILTGKNGCGKTSVLNELSTYISKVVSGTMEHIDNYMEMAKNHKVQAEQTTDPDAKEWHMRQSNSCRGMALELTNMKPLSCYGNWTDRKDVVQKYKQGKFITAYYGDTRRIGLTPYNHIENVTLKKTYGIAERPSAELGKYLANLKATQAFANAKGDNARAEGIANWFTQFEDALKELYQDEQLCLDFNIDTFQFTIHVNGREPFDFNTMSMGYAAVFDIVADLMMRMESQHSYDLEGIVLIDEIETHLHVELQKQVVPFLMRLFPNIQFILTTHSPFILNSAPNSVIYDLEKHLRVPDGMENLSYEGIVEGYFKVDRYSQKLLKYFEEYKQLVTSENLSDLDYARIAELEDYLDEVPDYLSLDFAHEYSRLKAEFDN